MISVIVPIYNAEQYLAQCVDSILNQTYTELEIILVDDGSTDSSGSMCDDYAKRDLRVRVLHKENGGLVSARKTGVHMATGEYVAFVDADDWVEPDMYARFSGIIRDYDVDIVLSGHFEDNGATSKKIISLSRQGYYDKNNLANEIYPHMISNAPFFEWGIFPGIWEKLFRRELLEVIIENVDNRIVMGEDAACVYPYMMSVRNAYILHECYYHYRQQPFSMVRQVARNIAKERMRFLVLYETVDKIMASRTDVATDEMLDDLRTQWLQYILFLMIPRADVLYEGIQELDYLFPFSGIKQNDNIVIYGAGIWGQRLFDFLKKTNFCKVVALADRNYEELNKNGQNVISPDDIGKYQYDAIAVTSSFGKTTKGIYNDLRQKYPNAHICTIDEEVIYSNDTLVAFGLRKNGIK